MDALEHFFWNVKGGIAIELGALDGTNNTRSQSAVFEEVGWRRILIEGNPLYRTRLATQKEAFTVNVAACKSRQTVHYLSHYSTDMTSGIAEFMTPFHLHTYFKPLSKAIRKVHGIANITDWSSHQNGMYKISEVPCVPMSGESHM